MLLNHAQVEQSLHIFILTDSKREAIDLLLKASGYLEFCLRDILTRIPPEMRYFSVYRF